MSNPMYDKEMVRLLAKLAYLRKLVPIQAKQLEKSILEIADIAEKLGIHIETVKSIRGLAKVITDIKDGLVNITIMIRNLKGEEDDNH
jgi:hypothetical protein